MIHPIQMKSNPYQSTTDPESDESVQECRVEDSGWAPNAKAFAFNATAYFVVSIGGAIVDATDPEPELAVLFAASALSSGWANFRWGPPIGWDRGGLPILFVVYFSALTIYIWVSIFVSSAIQSLY